MSKKIMIVDDSRTARMHLSSPLQKEGFVILEAGNGQEAIDTIATMKEPLDLIITDHSMPHKSGVDMVTELRAMKDNPNANISVIFITSDSSQAVREKCMQLKAMAIVLKPVNLDALVGVIKKVLAAPPR